VHFRAQKPFGGQDGVVAQALVVSVALSVVLTVALNVVLWLFPSAGRRLHEGAERLVGDAPHRADRRPGVRVIVPWKLMLLGSLVLTVVLNLALSR
jgi:hypothetical protein